MTSHGWMQIGLFALVIAAVTKPMGVFLFKVLEGKRHPFSTALGPLERAIYRVCGIDPSREQGWREYAGALLALSAMGALVTYALQRLQHVLPLNPQGWPAVEPALAFNTAV